MRKFLRIVLACLFCLTLPGCAVATEERQGLIVSKLPSPQPSNRTKEEHLALLRRRTEEMFAVETESGNLISIQTEIVYPFVENDFFYFLIELEYARAWQSGFGDVQYTTKYKHLLGVIINDQYYAGVFKYDNGHTAKDCFMDGRSPYYASGYVHNKKYAGGKYQGVETKDGIIMVADADCLLYDGENYEFHTHNTYCSDYYQVGDIMPDYLLKLSNYDYYSGYMPSCIYQKGE